MATWQPSSASLASSRQHDTLALPHAESLTEFGMPRTFERAGEREARFGLERRADFEPHASLCTDDHDAGFRVRFGLGHRRIPRSFITTLSRSRLASSMVVSGSRISASHQPSAAQAALSGIGLVSQKSTSKSGNSS